jgi:hypothetical protein
LPAEVACVTDTVVAAVVEPVAPLKDDTHEPTVTADAVALAV